MKKLALTLLALGTAGLLNAGTFAWDYEWDNVPPGTEFELWSTSDLAGPWAVTVVPYRNGVKTYAVTLEDADVQFAKVCAYNPVRTMRAWCGGLTETNENGTWTAVEQP